MLKTIAASKAPFLELCGLRKVQPRTREELDQAVSTFINSLNKEDVIGYFIEAGARAALT